MSTIAPEIETIIKGLEFPNIIGIGPIIIMPPVSTEVSESSLNVDRSAPEIIRMTPKKTTIKPNAINRSKFMIQKLFK